MFYVYEAGVPELQARIVCHSCSCSHDSVETHKNAMPTCIAQWKPRVLYTVSRKNVQNCFCHAALCWNICVWRGSALTRSGWDEKGCNSHNIYRLWHLSAKNLSSSVQICRSFDNSAQLSGTRDLYTVHVVVSCVCVCIVDAMVTSSSDCDDVTMMYRCSNQRCIPRHLVNNSVNDCADNSDEG